MLNTRILKSRKFKIFAIILLIYILFAAIILIGFYSIRNNPTDKIAMPFIWKDESLQSQYGELKSVCRYHGYETEKTENIMRVPYSVETENYEVFVYVNLEKNSEDWEAKSLEVLKVIKNVNKT